jgi:hypothetical protein
MGIEDDYGNPEGLLMDWVWWGHTAAEDDEGGAGGAGGAGAGGGGGGGGGGGAGGGGGGGGDGGGWGGGGDKQGEPSQVCFFLTSLTANYVTRTSLIASTTRRAPPVSTHPPPPPRERHRVTASPRACVAACACHHVRHCVNRLQINILTLAD